MVMHLSVAHGYHGTRRYGVGFRVRQGGGVCHGLGSIDSGEAAGDGARDADSLCDDGGEVGEGF